jgi:hypothetical protein
MKAFALALRNATSGNAQAVGSGALRWTHYAPANAANSGSLGNGPVLGRSLASASSSLIKQPQIALGDTTKRPTIGQQIGGGADYAGTASAPLRRSISRRSALLLGAVALVALVAMIAVGMSVSSAMGLFTNSVNSPTLTHKPKATATATAAPTATATPAPTNTPYVITPTAPPPPPAARLSISPTTITMTGSWSCAATFMISNLDYSSVTWKWASSQPSLDKSGLSWNLNSTGWHSGLPYDSQGIARFDGSTVHTDSVSLKMSCKALQQSSSYAVTMTDSLGRSYSLTIKQGG